MPEWDILYVYFLLVSFLEFFVCVCVDFYRHWVLLSVFEHEC